MESKKNKTLILNTLLLVFCVIVITLFCFGPSTKETEVLASYNITFDSDGGTAIAALKIEEGKTIDQPEMPTKDGYIFVGWMLDDELYDFASEVTGDVTLKAKWEEKKPDVKYYTINFSSSGGSIVTPITVQEGATGTAPIPPVREGFTFVGWQLNGLNYDFTQPVNSDITLVAVWEVVPVEPEEPEEPEKPDVKTYKVRFNLNGGTGGNAKAQTVEEGKKATAPSKNPTRKGYTFVGWYLNGKAYNFGTVVNKDITLIAQWQVVTVKEFYVDVYNADESMCTMLTVEEGKTATIPKKCASQRKIGYSFKGWNTSKNATTANFFSGKTKVTKTIKIYPAFAKKVFNVSATEVTDGTTAGGYKLTVDAQGETISKMTISYRTPRGDIKSIDFYKNSKWSFNNKFMWENLTDIKIELEGSSEIFDGVKK